MGNQLTTARRLGLYASALAISIATGVACLRTAAADSSAPTDQTQMSPEATPTQNSSTVFKPDPNYAEQAYDPNAQLQIYGGKNAVMSPRPLFELGRPLYQEGLFDPGLDYVGEKNLLFPGAEAFGDFRNAVAWNDNGKEKQIGDIASRVDLDVDLNFTATERLHAFFEPITRHNVFANYQAFGPDADHQTQFDPNLIPQDLFFEGDGGSIYSGLTDKFANFDFPFAVGLVPMLFQNGIWMNDAIAGGAFTIPARNSPELGISNMDTTFFAGFDKVQSDAFKNRDGSIADDNTHVYGFNNFIETMEGYWEAGFGYVQGVDRFNGEGFASATAAYTHRYSDLISNSVRAIWDFGQSEPDDEPKTADGVVFLIENSFITEHPDTLVPYMNLFAGFNKPAPLAIAPANNLLTNTGINFQTDGLTGFPKLDDTAHNTYGGALGTEYLFNYDRQLVFEVASVRVMGSAVGRPAPGDETALGSQFQQPLSKDWILELDAMYGHIDNSKNIGGARAELRLKF